MEYQIQRFRYVCKFKTFLLLMAGPCVNLSVFCSMCMPDRAIELPDMLQRSYVREETKWSDFKFAFCNPFPELTQNYFFKPFHFKVKQNPHIYCYSSNQNTALADLITILKAD